MHLTKGSRLTPEARAIVRSRFVHWHLDTTVKTFDQWCNGHAFYFTRAGQLSKVHRHCEPAWMADTEGNNAR